MGRLRRIDQVILGILGPLWLLCFCLTVFNLFEGRLAEPRILVGQAASDRDYPVLLSIRAHAAATESGISVGDRLVRIGTCDLRGRGPLYFFACALEAKDDKDRAELEILRDGERQVLWLDYTPSTLPLRFPVVSLSCALMALLIISRAPRSREAILWCRALLLFAFVMLRFWGGPSAQTYFFVFAMLFIGALAPATVIYALLAFPEFKARKGIAYYTLPWLFIPLAPITISFISGGYPPLSDDISLLIQSQMVGLICFGAALITIISRTYRRLDPIGRRQVKWVLLGLYVSLVPVSVTTGLAIWDDQFRSYAAGSEIFHTIIPVSIYIAIARYGLFDIDRLISATTSYSILIGLVMTTSLVLVPFTASAISDVGGMEPISAQIMLSVILVPAVLLGHRYLGPKLDGWLFPEREALERNIHELLQELPQFELLSDLVVHVGRRIDELLRPDRCVVYLQSAAGFAPLFARGEAAPAVLEHGDPVITVLRKRREPLAAEGWSRRRAEGPLSSFDRAVLETLDMAVLIPIRKRDELVAFACLGPKRSGDLYTPGDLSLLAIVADQISAELHRYDDAEILRQSQQAQTALRRYVPGAIAEELDSHDKIESEEREVSVLFVDIRGYSSYAESRPPEEVFATINRFTETVSAVVRRHAGSVVEFNGDGMMAVFGAPRELAAKERAAVEAGRAIIQDLRAIPPSDEVAGDGLESTILSVGVGVATGNAFVGNIRAVDRMIWSAIGNTTNRAARLEALTRPLDVVMIVDEATQRLAEMACAGFEKRVDVSIKGYSEPITIFVLVDDLS